MHGRWRLVRHLLVAALAAAGAWCWFGGSGLLPMLLWAWHRRPRPGTPERLVIHSVRSVRLGGFRTRIQLGWNQSRDVFHDELPAEALAALRRRLKSAWSAGDGP